MSERNILNTNFYLAAGPSTGPALVLIHGAVVSKESWLPQLEALSDHYRVIAVDLPGHGSLAKIPFSFESSVRVIAEAIRRETTRPVLVAGLSLGGYTAVEFASACPAQVRGLILSGCIPRLKGVLGQYLKIIGRMMKAGWLKEKREKVEERVQKMYPPALRKTGEAQIAAGVFPEALGDVFLEMVGKDYGNSLKKYSGSVFLLNGELDKTSRRGEMGFIKSFPQVKVKLVPNAGHACCLDQPVLYNAAVRGIADQIFQVRFRIRKRIHVYEIP
jgi:pimeloyl-ACP methyl ester carboxylesterase